MKNQTPVICIALCRAFLSASLVALSACGGGGGGAGGGGGNVPGSGGGGSPPPAAPTLSLISSDNSAEAGGTVLLTWTTTGATACTASGGWTGVRQGAGTEVVGVLEAQRQFTLSCTGAGGTVSRTVDIAVSGLDPLAEPTAPGYQLSLARSFPLGAGEGVKDIEVDEARRKVYVSVNNHVVVLSADTYLLERIVPVGASAQGMSLSGDGSRLYVALFQGGAIAVMDTRTFVVRTVEVALQTGSPNIYDVAEVRPGVVLVSAYGSSLSTRTSFAVALDVDDPSSVKLIGDRNDVRGGPTFHLTPDHSRVFYSYFEGSAGPGRTVSVDTTVADFPVLHRSPDNYRLPDQAEFSQNGEWLLSTGGAVIEASSLTLLRRGVMSGVVAKSADGSEIGALGAQFYLFDGQTLRLKSRFQIDGCSNSVTNVLKASGRRGEWIAGNASSEICVFSTTLDSMSKPGSDGSRQFPVPPAQKDLPVIESHIAGLGPGAVVDPVRHRVYVTMESPTGIASIDSDTGLPVDFLPLSATPGSLKLSWDGARLMAGMNGNGNVLVIDVAGWVVDKQLDLSSLLIQPNVTAFVQVGPNAWITTAANSNPLPGMQYPLVLFDPDNLAAARRVGHPQGYCGYIPAVSPDRRYLYAPHANCTLVLEKRDMQLPDWDAVAASDGVNWLTGQDTMEISADGARLYTDQGLVYSTTTLRQIGRFLGQGHFREIPNTSLVTVHNVDSMAVYDRETLLPVALGGGYCEAYRETFNFDSPGLFPDFSRGAVLGGGTISWPRTLCLTDFRELLN